MANLIIGVNKMVLDKETEKVVLNILTSNESLLRELKVEQDKQKVLLDNVMATVDSLMDFVDKEGL
tara:strand:- start:495 stop:692 length:198 start_codon:yes stop_codon:yes gene_type:complete